MSFGCSFRSPDGTVIFDSSSYSARVVYSETVALAPGGSFSRTIPTANLGANFMIWLEAVIVPPHTVSGNTISVSSIPRNNSTINVTIRAFSFA